MATPLLKTKNYIPLPLSKFVSRQALLDRLDAGLDGRMTLVAAPAGFGKTTMISSWVRDVGHPTAWVSLDEADNDPALFWAYLVSGLQSLHLDGDGVFWGQIGNSQLPPTRSLLPQIINALAEEDEKIVLVLDDYHVISNPQIHKDFAYLIDNLPPALHIVILTRADPPLPIARLRGRGLLTEIRASDLRFTTRETGIFLNEMMQLDLSADAIATLDQRTEGWIIGLQLAAISMQGRSDKDRFIADFSGSHHFILEYLTEEVVDLLPESLRRFALQTAILDQFSAALCDSILGGDDSAIRLDELQHNNLFIIPLNDEHTWFRYHHLFRDLLKNRLRREFSNEHILECYQRASHWYQEAGEQVEAIKYRLLSKDFDGAAEVIEQAAGGTMLHGHLTTLLGWIEALPEAVLDARPRIRLYQGWAYSLGGQHQVAENILLSAKSKLEILPETPESRTLRGELAALLTGIMVYENDPDRIIQEAREALTYLSEDDLISRARVHIALGTAWAYSDEMEKAGTAYKTARVLAHKAGNPFLATAAIEMLTGMQIFHLGQLMDAAQNLEQVIELGRTGDGTLLAFTGTAHVLLAAINLEWNNLNAAERYLDKGVELIEQGGIGYSLPHTYCTKARLDFAQRKPDQAAEALRLANQAVQNAPLMHLLIHNLSCQVRLALNLGDIKAASDWINPDSPIRRNLPKKLPAYLNEVLQISAARVDLAQGEMETTLETLDNIYSGAEAAGRMAHLIEIYLLKTLAYLGQSEPTSAIDCLKNAVSVAAPQGYQRVFLEAGNPVRQLLKSSSILDFKPRFIGELLAAFDEFDRESKQLGVPAIQPAIINSLVEPLSERECEVLRLVAAGYTNQQIANELVVSLNTVKKHTTHIYGKMGVKNRTQAIAMARELKLIS
jgi:LuxR family maltose regulon positive regulatory protein